MAENKGIVQRINYGEVFLFVLCNIQQQYAMGIERDTLNKAMYSWMKNWSQMRGTHVQILDAWNYSLRDNIDHLALSQWRFRLGAK